MSSPAITPAKAWLYLGTLIVGYIGVYLCRKNSSVAVPLLQADLGVTKAQVGVVASVSTLADALGKFFFGPGSDRFGGRSCFLLSLVGVAIFGGLGGLVTGLAALTWLYSANRLTGSAAWGGMVKLVPDWFTGKQLPLALAILSLSFVFGGALATLFAGEIAHWSNNSWRAVMGVPSLVSLVLLVVAWFILPKRGSLGGPADSAVSTSDEARESSWERIKHVLAVRQLWIVLALSFGLTMFRETFNTWTVDFIKTEGGEAVSSRFVRAETIFPAAQRAGRKVAVITAKEKLRDIFASGLIDAGGIAFSSEKARAARQATQGVEDMEQLVGPTPNIYSGDASLYVLCAGVRLLEAGRADFLYLSTTGFMQHAYAPTEPEALEFYAAIDVELGKLAAAGAVIGVTADHGMNAKQRADGSPNVIYLETELVKHFGPGFRVILPITDPYVVHHGALGSFAQVHLPPDYRSRFSADEVIAWLYSLAGVAEVMARDPAARLMELPPDRMGDVVVAAGRDVVLGRTPEHHDLAKLHGGLRSHGGRYEEMVPFVFSHPLNSTCARRAAGDPRNFHIFDFTLNGTLC